MSCFGHHLRLFSALACWSALVASIPQANAMVVRTYSAASHQRFSPFPVSPAINTNHIFSAVDLTGVGFKSTNLPTVQCTLVGRKHILFAAHYGYIINGETLTFVNAANQVVTRTCTTQTVIWKDGNQSDLVLVELNEPIDSDSGISPLPYYATAPVVGVTALGILGRKNAAPDSGNPIVGEATYDVAAELADIGGGINTMVYGFNYLTAGLGDNDCYLQSGDSGSPAFVNVSGTAALIGIHSAIDTIPGGQVNYDTLVPHYITELDAVLNPLGFRMRPHNAPATTLSGSSNVTQTTPRKAMALDYEFTIENTGSEVAGNVEIQLDFATGEGPDSVSGTGWVAYGSGDRWTIRRSSLTAAAQSTITASWTTAPSVNTLSFTVAHRSDTSGESSANEDIALGESFADWASALAQTGQGDDPDADTILNLSEYAFGGDGAVASHTFADGGPLLPVIDLASGTATCSHPERSDKAARGLAYDIEFSTDLTSWTGTTPPGFSTTTAAYDPAVPGFVQRRWSWTAGATQFARIKLTLSE